MENDIKRCLMHLVRANKRYVPNKKVKEAIINTNHWIDKQGLDNVSKKTKGPNKRTSPKRW